MAALPASWWRQAQLQPLVTPQQALDPLSLCEGQGSVAFRVSAEQLHRHQLSKQAAPLAAIKLLANAIHAQIGMAQLPDPCRISPEQYIGEMGSPEATVAAIDG